MMVIFADDNIVYLLRLPDDTICILRSPADSDAFQSGRYAVHNGRPKTLDVIV